MKREILLGLTGSVASVLYEKLIDELSKVGQVTVILTKSAHHFISMEKFCDALERNNASFYTDEDEWKWKTDVEDGGVIIGKRSSNKWKKNDPILHIELRNTHSAFVIVPCSANTLAKLAHGMCDNLLTSIALAWDRNRPLIIAPSMNTNMWHHPATNANLETISKYGYKFVNPQTKMLACNTYGEGAMAEIGEIVCELEDSLRWQFPLTNGGNFQGIISDVSTGIPINDHPGAFLTKRKHHTHTGVDLYCEDGSQVSAMESGKIVSIESFTGPSDESPWWNDTQCVLIEGASGVICYGEITPAHFRKIGDIVSKGDWIGNVKRVLKEGKERPDIQGHKPNMLHIELYPHGKTEAFRERGNIVDSFSILQDPTPYLLKSKYCPEIKLTK